MMSVVEAPNSDRLEGCEMKSLRAVSEGIEAWGCDGFPPDAGFQVMLVKDSVSWCCEMRNEMASAVLELVLVRTQKGRGNNSRFHLG